MLELEGLRYVGTGPQASKSAWTRPVAKVVVAKSAISTPDYVTYPNRSFGI